MSNNAEATTSGTSLEPLKPPDVHPSPRAPSQRAPRFQTTEQQISPQRTAPTESIPGGAEDPQRRGDVSEIGKLAVWSVTSAKPGNGVELLRDNSLDTYWQSDGAQPHLVNVQFQKKVRLRELAIYADYRLDESYTPNKISVRAGNSFHDLREIKTLDLDEPSGWTRVTLTKDEVEGVTRGDGSVEGECLRTYFLQVAVLSNHQNGRDTHIRQVKIYGPRTSPEAMIGQGMQFSSAEFAQFATVR